MYRLYANSVILFKGLEHLQILLSTGEPPKPFPLGDQGRLYVQMEYMRFRNTSLNRVLANVMVNTVLSVLFALRTASSHLIISALRE